MQMQYDNIQQIQSYDRKVNALFAVAAVLVAAIVGITWYGYPTLKAQGAQLAALIGTKPMLSDVHERMAAVEQSLTGLASDRDKLNERLTGLEKLKQTMNARFAQIRIQTTQAVVEAENRLAKDITAMQSRVAKVENTQSADQAKLETLQNDLARTKEEMAAMQQQTQEQMASFHREATGHLSDVNQRISATNADMDSLANRVSSFRLEFEVNAGQPEELYSGVRLTVKGTNVERQNVEGWLQLMSNGRTLWVRNQGLEQPLAFYVAGSDRPYQLVFTRVLDHSVVGYLLIPNDSRVKTATTAANN